jgi:hypothetical protein
MFHKEFLNKEFLNGSTRVRLLIALTTLAASTGAWSADPPTPEAAAERTTLEAQYAFTVDVVSGPELDPVVFTEIVPFTADESAVRLPPDQDLD